MLSHAALNEVLRKRSCKAVCLDRHGQIAIEDGDGDLRVGLGDVHQSLAPRAPAVRLATGSHGPRPARVDRDGRRCVRKRRNRARTGTALRGLGELAGIKAERVHAARILLGGRAPAVELGQVLHEGHALSDHGVCEHHRGNTVIDRVGERRVKCGEVVTVALEHTPAVRSPVLGDGDRHHIVGVTGDLDVVPVDDRREIPQLLLDGQPARLADLPLLLLAIRHRYERVPLAAAQSRAQSEPDSSREALPQVAARPLDARNRTLDVTLEHAACLPEVSHELLGGEEAGGCQRGVRARRSVAVADDDTVTPLPARLLRTQVRHGVQERVDLHRRHRAARMTGSSDGGCREDVAATDAGPLPQFGELLGGQGLGQGVTGHGNSSRRRRTNSAGERDGRVH